MSTVIRTLTPFINKKLLQESLAELGHQTVEQNGKILLQNLAGYRPTYFEQKNGRFMLIADSHTRTKKIMQDLERKYLELYQKKLQEEKQRLKLAELQRIQVSQAAYETAKREAETARLEAEQLERERKQYVAQQEKAILESAKKMGYTVEKIRKKNKATQYVFVKR